MQKIALLGSVASIVSVLLIFLPVSVTPESHSNQTTSANDRQAPSEAHVTIGGAVKNSTIVAGADNEVTIENIEGVSPEQFQELAGKLGVTEAALKSFFEILEQADVPRNDLDSALRKIATRYKKLDKKEREAVENGDLESTGKLMGLVSQYHKVPVANTEKPVDGKLRLNVKENGKRHIPLGLHETN
jgi:hypothetical protein